MGTTDVGAGFAIGFGGDAAGVDDDHVSIGGVAFVDPGGAEKCGDGFSVGAGGTATEVFDVDKGRHRISLAKFGLVGWQPFPAVSGALTRR